MSFRCCFVFADIYVIIEEKPLEKSPKQQLCEYLVPSSYVRVKPPTPIGLPHEYLELEGISPPLPPKQKQRDVYKVDWLNSAKTPYSSPQKGFVLSNIDKKRLDSIRESRKINKKKTQKENETIYYITEEFVKDYTPVSELEGLRCRGYADESTRFLEEDKNYTPLKKGEFDVARDGTHYTNPPINEHIDRYDQDPLTNPKSSTMKALNNELREVCASRKPVVDRRSRTNDLYMLSKETTGRISNPVPDNVYLETSLHEKDVKKGAERKYTDVKDEDRYGQYAEYYESGHKQSRGCISRDDHRESPQYLKDYGGQNTTEYNRTYVDTGFTRKSFEQMTIDDVCCVLKLLNLEKHVEDFRYNLIDGVLLKDLNEDMLKNEFRFNAIETLRMIKFIRTRYIPKS